MAATKQYVSPDKYEDKLRRVMDRFGVEEYNWDYSRREAWVSFRYKGQLYRFEQSVDNAKAHGIDLVYGTDAFAQIVLSLEDLARMVERGIYDLSTWVAGMKALPEQAHLPSCFVVLGFTELPKDMDSLTSQYRTMLKKVHPDVGGSSEAFQAVQNAYKECKEVLGNQ